MYSYMQFFHSSPIVLRIFLILPAKNEKNIERGGYLVGKRNKILVPEAREQLDQLKARVSNTNDPDNAKFESAQEQRIPFVNGYNGEIKAKDAGKIGGNIGGKMVRELVKMAENQLTKKN